MTKRVICYCAIGETSYLDLALASAAQLRRLKIELPIVVFSDIDLNSNFQKRIKQLDIEIKEISLSANNPFASRLLKTLLPELIDSFDEVLYLDADLLPLQSIDSVWQSLHVSEISMVLDISPTINSCHHISLNEKQYTLNSYPQATKHFNSGVIAFHKTKPIINLFKVWEWEWLRFRKHDQLALARAAELMRISVAELPLFFNYPLGQVKNINQIPKDIILLHCFSSINSPNAVRNIFQIIKSSSTAIIPNR